MDMSLNKLREIVKDREPGVLQSMQSTGSQRLRHNLMTEQQQQTTPTKKKEYCQS